MTKLSLLSLPILHHLVVLLLLLATSLPPTAAAVPVRVVFEVEGSRSYVQCAGHGVYAANSTYEANRRRLAGLLAEAAAHGSSYTDLAVGYWPNRLQAFVSCRRGRDADDSGRSSCAACVAGAFLEAESACPYHREAFVSSRNCSLQISEFRIFGDDGLGGIFQGRNTLMQSLGFGINISSNWICLALLLATTGMAQPEKRHYDAFHTSLIWRLNCSQLGHGFELQNLLRHNIKCMCEWMFSQTNNELILSVQMVGLILITLN